MTLLLFDEARATADIEFLSILVNAAMWKLSLATVPIASIDEYLDQKASC